MKQIFFMSEEGFMWKSGNRYWVTNVDSYFYLRGDGNPLIGFSQFSLLGASKIRIISDGLLPFFKPDYVEGCGNFYDGKLAGRESWCCIEATMLEQSKEDFPIFFLTMIWRRFYIKIGSF